MFLFIAIGSALLIGWSHPVGVSISAADRVRESNSRSGTLHRSDVVQSVGREPDLEVDSFGTKNGEHVPCVAMKWDMSDGSIVIIMVHGEMTACRTFPLLNDSLLERLKRVYEYVAHYSF
jgi:hypothetical protein